VERVVEREKVRFCIFIFAEKVDENGIFVSAIMFCHKTSCKEHPNSLSKMTVLL